MPALVLFQPPKPTTVPFHYSRASSQRGGLRGRWLHSALVVALHLPARFANPTQPKVPALVLFGTPDPRTVPFPNSIVSRQEFQGAACCFAAGTPAARICVMCKMLTACKERLHLRARLTPPVPSRPSPPTTKPSVVLFHPPSVHHLAPLTRYPCHSRPADRSSSKHHHQREESRSRSRCRPGSRAARRPSLGSSGTLPRRQHLLQLHWQVQ